MRFVPYLPPKMSGRPTEGQGPDYAQIRAQLKRNPGLWGEIPERELGLDNPSSFAYRVRNGQSGFSPTGAYEAAVRGGRLFIRFKGDHR